MFADLHNDVLTSGLSPALVDDYLAQIYAQKPDCRVAVVAWTTQSVFCSSEKLQAVLLHLKAKFGYIDFSIEDLGGLDSVDIVDFLPISYASLTWNFDNRFAGGATGIEGLTKQGREVIARCENRGIIIDTAHLNRRSFFEVADASRGVLICSHTCASGACLHPRNLNDEQLRLIAQRNGIVGVCFVGNFLCDSGNATSNDVVRHIDYIVEKIGIQHVGIGSDFFGTLNLPSDIKNYNSLSIIVEKLQKLGYNERDIDLVFKKNYARIFGDRRTTWRNTIIR